MKKKGKTWLGFENLAFMMQFLKGHLFSFWIGTLMMSSFAFMQSVFIGQLYCTITAIGENSSMFFLYFLRIFVLLLIVIAVSGIGIWIFTRATACGDQMLRRQLAYKMSRMPIKNWYGRHSGEWLTILGKDADNASYSYKQQIARFISLAIELLGGIIVLAFQSPILLVYALISGILYLNIGLLRRKRSQKYELENQKATATAAAYLADILNGFVAMRIYRLLQSLIKKQGEAIEASYKYNKKIASIIIINGALGQIGYTLAYSGAFIVGLLLVYQGWLHLSTMLALWPICMGVSFSMMQFGFFVTEMQKVVVAVEHIRLVMDLPKETEGIITKISESDIVLELCNVSFTYDQERYALKNINLKIYKGEKIAFVGESGSGKSTLVKLFMRFYDVQQGEVLIGGHRVQDYTLEALRGQFSYVSQSSYLFSGSIYQNISIVKENATQDQVKMAARNACAEDFICELPNGYDTLIGERGTQLSGGQRQRIAIARAFLNDAPILVFDEISAALDSESATKVQQAVEHIPEEKTLLMITHRLSAAVTADRIVVMENGGIVEIGSHSELLAEGKVYARLWNMQYTH